MEGVAFSAIYIVASCRTTVILHMLLLGILTLTDGSIWTFKFLHVVMRALHENVTILAYLNRVVPNGRDGTLAIHNVTSCRTYRHNLNIHSP